MAEDMLFSGESKNIEYKVNDGRIFKAEKSGNRKCVCLYENHREVGDWNTEIIQSMRGIWITETGTD